MITAEELQEYHNTINLMDKLIDDVFEVFAKKHKISYDYVCHYDICLNDIDIKIVDYYYDESEYRIPTKYLLLPIEEVEAIIDAEVAEKERKIKEFNDREEAAEDARLREQYEVLKKKFGD